MNAVPGSVLPPNTVGHDSSERWDCTVQRDGTVPLSALGLWRVPAAPLDYCGRTAC